MTIKPIGLSLLALLLCGPLACSKTTMAGPYAPETCEEIGTQESSLESVDIMGFSAAAILDTLSAPNTTQVTYLDNTTSTITAQVTYTGGGIQLVEQTPTPAGEDWYPEEPCMNYIDIEATLTLTSEGAPEGWRLEVDC